MPRSYDQREMKLLWGLSAGRCAFPSCRIELAVGSAGNETAGILGHVAHIVASSNDGPRGDRNFPVGHRDKYSNLILLCPTHHTQVDVQSGSHTVDQIRTWKVDHETWVRERLAVEVAGVGFAELEVVSKAILASPAQPDNQYSLTPLATKLQRNQLSNVTAQLLTIGLSKANEVKRFVAHISEFDASFPERLKAGFVGEYVRSHGGGKRGDELFESLRVFAAQGHDFIQAAAGLAVLVYLFEACEVFER